MSTATELAKIEQIKKVIEGLEEIKKTVYAAGGNKYASRVLKSVNTALLDAEWEKTRLLFGEA